MQAKIKRNLILITMIFFSFQYSLFACSCDGELYFCHEISDTTDSFLHPEYVLRGIKLKDTLHGMFLRIEYQYINEIPEDTILIWGDPGHLCRVYTSTFEIGDTIILGISRLEFDSGMPQESIGDYWLPACGITYLEIENGIVEGPISAAINAMPLESFEEYMANGDYVNCGTTGTEQPDQPEIELYPNPAYEAVFIGCENCDELQLVSVYNAVGASINIPAVKEGNTIQLNVAGLEKGVYFVQLKIRDKWLSHKLLVF